MQRNNVNHSKFGSCHRVWTETLSGVFYRQNDAITFSMAFYIKTLLVSFIDKGILKGLLQKGDLFEGFLKVVYRQETFWRISIEGRRFFFKIYYKRRRLELLKLTKLYFTEKSFKMPSIWRTSFKGLLRRKTFGSFSVKLEL